MITFILQFSLTYSKQTKRWRVSAEEIISNEYNIFVGFSIDNIDRWLYDFPNETGWINSRAEATNDQKEAIIPDG